MHEYTVELRVSSAGLDPVEITREIGLHPSHSRPPGEYVRSSGRKSEGAWGYAGKHADGSRREWPSLDAGLGALLDELMPYQPAIARLQVHHDVIWWCGHFQSSFDGGPTLSAPLLARLADFGVPVVIDNYFVDEAVS